MGCNIDHSNHESSGPLARQLTSTKVFLFRNLYSESFMGLSMLRKNLTFAWWQRGRIIHGRRIRPPCGISDLIATWAAALAAALVGIRSGGDRELQPQRRKRKAVWRVVPCIVWGCAAREARFHGAWAWRRDKPNTRANKRSKRSSA